MKTFWERVKKTDYCWEWQGSHTKNGYGQVYMGKRSGYNYYHYAHRVAFALTYGKIPNGLHICHHCDNPKCVRPDHLFSGTRSDNLYDASLKNRFPNNKVIKCKLGHEYTKENTKIATRKNGRIYRQCRKCKRIADKKYESHRPLP